MATPVNFQPPQPYTPGQTSVSTPPAGETALVLNINSPLITHGNGVTPTPAAQACATPASDLFQRKTNASFAPNPNSSPAQQLQDAYANALTIRNDAEQARTNFLNLASQLENQALSKPAQPAIGPTLPPSSNPFTQSAQPLQSATLAPAPAFQAPAPPLPQPDPTQQFQQQLQALQQQQPAQIQQPAYDPALQQQLMQQPQMMDPMQQQMLQQQMMQQQAAMQQPQMMDPMQQQMLQQQMMQQPQAFSGANINDLNTMIAQPRTPDEKLNALNAIAVNQLGDRQTYELLKQEVANPMQGVPPEAATAIRQAALIALGSLNGSPVNARVPGNQLYGMDAIKQILTNKNENPLVKASAVASLGYMNRPQDAAIQDLLRLASKDSNPDVKNAVAQVTAGQMIAPGQVAATPAV